MNTKNLILRLFCSFLFISFSLGLLTAQTTSAAKKKKENKQTAYTKTKNFDVSYLVSSNTDELDLDFSVGDSKNYLLLMAVDKYKYWKSLSNPVKDARDIKRLLKDKYGFEDENIFEYYNEEVTPESVREAFEKLKEKGTNIDNLLVYYSGHGYYDPSFDLGYWVPSEGKTNSGATGTYIPNDNIRNYVKALEFKHVFLVADACFSGALFQDDNATKGLESEKMESIKSRWGLSAGNIEEVSDGEKGKNSPFAYNFINYLQNNLKDKLQVKELIDFVVAQVKANTQQEPIGKPLSGVGHEGGQFGFKLQGSKDDPAKTDKDK